MKEEHCALLAPAVIQSVDSEASREHGLHKAQLIHSEAWELFHDVGMLGQTQTSKFTGPDALIPDARLVTEAHDGSAHDAGRAWHCQTDDVPGWVKHQAGHMVHPRTLIYQLPH